MEDKTIYKSNMAIHITCAIIRAFIIFIPLILIMGLLQNRVLFIWSLVNLFGDWSGVILFSFLCALTFSLISLSRKKTEITVDNDGGVSISQGSRFQRDYDLFDTIFVFQRETGGGIFHAFAFKWVMKVTESDGTTEKIYAYAFSKNTFHELEQHVYTIIEKFHEEGVWD